LKAFKAVYHNIEYDYEGLVSSEVAFPYNSANAQPLTREQLRAYFFQNGLLETIPSPVPLRSGAVQTPEGPPKPAIEV